MANPRWVLAMERIAFVLKGFYVASAREVEVCWRLKAFFLEVLANVFIRR